ncbi:nucleoside-diphosphate kinase [uncultured Tessaracoccus sp.]|uniref:nucleoside-diphosphate kinase n=1 Tax=uncultured Tessaracoccus sp. TaxID=905023 RepID=UPI0025D0B271|nr:nucleoside-diphosphate kinase [uncultured Tessaracoccus sp.]
MNRTFVIIKPDAVAAGQAGLILAAYEEAGLTIEAMELRRIDGAFSDRHYEAHVGRDFYPSLREFMTSGPLVAMVLSGEGAVQRVRDLNGATDPASAEAGTLRARFGTTVQRNVVHGSDSDASAEAEIALWFPGL